MVARGAALRKFVHEGTYILIGSILLAMAVIVVIFRGALNDGSGSKTLKWNASMWVVLNLGLVAAVAVRNWHYIEGFGLAFRRIGVLVFLLLSAVGLLRFSTKCGAVGLCSSSSERTPGSPSGS